MEINNAAFQPKPDWLKIKVQNNQERVEVEALLEKLSLNTVCKEANCPNLMECYCKKTATFMILGKECTRDCTFCNVTKGMPERVDPEEPVKVAEAVKSLGLKHVVVTSVTRDDLSDGGAEQFAEVIREIKKSTPEVTIEVLIPDFRRSRSALNLVIAAEPDIISHNIETVPRLYPEVRPSASYKRSLELLMNVKLTNDKILTKSGLMVGLGEKKEEVIETLEDLRTYGCNLLSIGQYLAPSKHHHPVVDYVHPEVFDQYKKIALDMGFRFVASAPFVRSSYHAGEVFETDLK